VYATDKGLDELVERRGDEQVTYTALADAMRDFVDLHPEAETAIERLAIFLARDDIDD
jgi:hypothetical protein